MPINNTLDTGNSALQLGYNGNAGSLKIFSGTSNRGQLIFQASANSGNTDVTVTNAAHGQASNYSVPDTGQASSSFIMADNASGQTIATGDLTLTVGSLTCTAGSVQAGSSGHAGSLKSFPGTVASGSLSLTAVNSGGNFAGVISNSSLGQATTWSLPDPGGATANIATAPSALVSGNVPKASGVSGLIIDSGIAANTIAISTITSPDAQSDVIWYDITCSAAALATAGKVNIQLSSGSKQYCIRNILMNKSTGLSGGGGDRLLALTDGTNVWTDTGITAALLGAPINTVWGGTGLPLPGGSNAFSTQSTAGQNIYFQYTGGTTDFTLGSVVISVQVQRVA